MKERAREAILRAAGIGGLYGVAYISGELGTTAALMGFAGMGINSLRMVPADVLGLLAQYALFGALLNVVLGVALRPLADRAKKRIRRFPGRYHGDLIVLALGFMIVGLLWNASSLLPRATVIAGATFAFVLCECWIFLGRAARRLLQRLPAPARRLTAWGTPVAGIAGVVVVAVVARGPSPAATTAGARAGAPHVVILLVDTLRRDHVSAYGYARPTSPTIDRIAAEGALFEDAYAPAPWTLPSHVSLFTGYYTTTHQTELENAYMPEDLPTMPAILAAAGYRTAGFSANPSVGPPTGVDRGFSHFAFVGMRSVTKTFFMPLAVERFLQLVGAAHEDLGGEAVSDAIIAWLDETADAKSPLFIFANYMEVHEPYGTVPEPFFSRYLDAPLPRDIGREWVLETPLFLCGSCDPAKAPSTSDGEQLSCSNDHWRASERRLQRNRDLYDAGITYVDHQIARVREALERHGILDDTLLIVTADHGERLGEGGQVGHGDVLHNAVLEVPLILRYPKRIAAGTRVGHPVSLVDVLATVEDVAELPAVHRPDTMSLLSPGLADRPPRVLAERGRVPERVWKAVGAQLGCDYSPTGRDLASLEKGDHKVVWYSDGESELFDLARDPREENDIAARDPERAQEMLQELEGWRSALRPDVAREAVPREIDPLTKKALEALGYVR